MKNKFNRVLIANRGEIACRIIKTCRALGYETVAVYSEADSHARHPTLADYSVCIGPAEVGESYLSPQAIIRAVSATKAQAVHPGYGFLSENSDFRRLCEEAGVVFIGPSTKAVELMGNKAVAKEHMIAAAVPCVPGYQGAEQSVSALVEQSMQIGLPVMIKAAAGGGGRGMRLASETQELPGAIERAKSEAYSAFGSDELILEKAVLGGKHIEVQVFGDSHGNVIHFGERDCSTQRRHQKVIEEAPSPILNRELRQGVCAAAVKAASAIGYENAGTVEFLLGKDNSFYFLEMNTRLQVEHPVTEMLTGTDLVKLQLAVAQGEALPPQESVQFSGHAIEARLYAEDPANDFLPRTGTVTRLNWPTIDDVRIDHGIKVGQNISVHYDAMIAKIIAWGEDRETARNLLIHTLEQMQLEGVETNAAFLLDLLQQPDFIESKITTAYLDTNYQNGTFANTPQSSVDEAAIAIRAALIQYYLSSYNAKSKVPAISSNQLYWCNSRYLTSLYRYGVGDDLVEVLVEAQGNDTFALRAGGEKELSVDSSRHIKDPQGYQLARVFQCSDGVMSVEIDGIRENIQFKEMSPVEILLRQQGKAYTFINSIHLSGTDTKSTSGAGSVISPMHGKLLALHVSEGDTVEEGQLVAVVEAMKLEHQVRSTSSGKVKNLNASEGEQIESGFVLFSIDAEE